MQRIDIFGIGFVLLQKRSATKEPTLPSVRTQAVQREMVFAKIDRTIANIVEERAILPLQYSHLSSLDMQNSHVAK